MEARKQVKVIAIPKVRIKLYEKKYKFTVHGGTAKRSANDSKCKNSGSMVGTPTTRVQTEALPHAIQQRQSRK